jgi:hypothetical protein
MLNLHPKDEKYSATNWRLTEYSSDYLDWETD